MNLLNRKPNTIVKTFYVDKHYLPFLLEETSGRYTATELESLEYFLSEQAIIYVYDVTAESLFHSTKRFCQISDMWMYDVVELQCLVEVTEMNAVALDAEVALMEQFEKFMAMKGKV